MAGYPDAICPLRNSRHTPLSASDHFRFRRLSRPLVLRKSSIRQGHLKAKDRTIRYIRTDQTNKIEAEVNEINRLLSAYEIRGATHLGFRRVFNQGDDPATYQWNKGGRLYSIGVDNTRLTRRRFAEGSLSMEGRLSRSTFGPAT